MFLKASYVWTILLKINIVARLTCFFLFLFLWKLLQGRIQAMWKLWFHKVKLWKLDKSNFHIKSGNLVMKSGKKRGKIINKIGENRSFHIVNIDTVIALVIRPSFSFFFCSTLNYIQLPAFFGNNKHRFFTFILRILREPDDPEGFSEYPQDP